MRSSMHSGEEPGLWSQNTQLQFLYDLGQVTYLSLSVLIYAMRMIAVPTSHRVDAKSK